MATGLSTRVVNVINLGRMGFLNAYDIQLRYARQHLDHLAGRSQAAGRNTLLLVEHNPVYTVGIRTNKYDQEEEKRLKKLGAEFYRTNRGGLITFHGPGQLVAYPILDLHQFHSKPSMKRYIATLELTIINACRRFGIEARTTEDTGVWVEDRKIAAIGVHGSRYVTTHGISLNCDTDLGWFRHIVPCGIEGKAATSLSKEVQKPTSIKQAVGPFLAAFEEEFECEMELNMLETEDADFLKSENAESAASAAGSASATHPPLQAAQQGMRLMSTSASTLSSQSTQQSRRRVSMW